MTRSTRRRPKCKIWPRLENQSWRHSFSSSSGLEFFKLLPSRSLEIDRLHIFHWYWLKAKECVGPQCMVWTHGWFVTEVSFSDLLAIISNNSKNVILEFSRLSFGGGSRATIWCLQCGFSFSIGGGGYACVYNFYINRKEEDEGCRRYILDIMRCRRHFQGFPAGG